MTQPIHIRASSFAELLDCPMRWQRKYLDGLRLPSSPPAAIGTAVHASTAAFDQSTIDGAGLSISDTAGVAVDSIERPGEEVDWRGASKTKAVEIALRVHAQYCTEIAPTQRYTIVEHTLKPLVVDVDDDISFELTGTLDRIRQNDLGLRGVADVKTGAAAVGVDGTVIVGKHTAQVGVYTLLAEEDFGPMQLPAAIIGLHTGGQARVGIGDVHGAREALVGTPFEPGILDFITPYFKTGLFPPNPGSFLCSPRYCPAYAGCKFHG